MIVAPKIRGFICTTAHPDGCAKHVAEQIAVVKNGGPISGGPKKVLVIGSSTGYGLSSRIAAAFGNGAATLGVFFEKPGDAEKSATAGWYNSAAFEKEAAAAGLYARSFNGDAFSDEMKAEVIAAIKADLGQVDCVIYSLASPRRTHPKTGGVFRSVLKPIGQSYTNKNLNTNTGVVDEVTIQPAEDDDVAQTVAVMGGEDWEMWLDALLAENLIAPGTQTFAYSYIGPELTWPIYKNGTIGKAKEDLERVQRVLDTKLAPLGGKAWVSVNKALVTQASSAIPVVPLYISLLYKVMKADGTHEDCIEQMDRLFRERYTDPQPDEVGRIRLDDWEMEARIQQPVIANWHKVTTENLLQLADIEGYQSSFLRLFGFGLEGVDYDSDQDIAMKVPSIG
ncbi:MAG: trans-2-enoyl-CoA reductase family protein [Luteolibacter sp.]|jgi:enoyl-[acyl-carrier protein] reductase/trans-2-enoyl-CoA reductase (NAD+)|nr:trans-2-enoyl-CoA reductase family protein [Luteolibacter sp.]